MRRIIKKVVAIISIIAILMTSFAMAATKVFPNFKREKYKVKLGTTQDITSIMVGDDLDLSNLKSSNSSVILLQDNGKMKALSTGISTLTYTYKNESGDSKEIYCYIEVTKDNATYSEITGSTTSRKVLITLDLGDSTATIENPVGALYNFPDVTKTGYVLEGWYKDANFQTKIQDKERVKESMTAYAKWVLAEEVEMPEIPKSELYDDIDTHWARNYIESVSYRGLFNGIDNRVFGPEQTMTRAMVITVLGRLDDVEMTGRKAKFDDVQSGSYYEEYVAWGLENKIVSGTSETTFSPNKEITREEMAIMMANYVKYKGYEYEAKEVYFSDADTISDYALESVKILNNLGIMKGNADGSYNPKKVATRAEIATVFFNYLNYINS